MREAPDGYQFHIVSEVNLGRFAEMIAGFHLQARGERRSPSYWRWCSLENPGQGCASALALRGGRIVGMLGNMYMLFSVRGLRHRAGLIGDLSVLESERSWACYRGLLSESGRRAARDGVSFGYGFVYRPLVEMNRRLGAESLGRVPVYAGFISAPDVLLGRGLPGWTASAGALMQPFVGLRGLGPAAEGVEVRGMTEPFGPAFDDLWTAVEAHRTVTVVRDAAYLNWRYVRCPDRNYVRLAAWRGGQPAGLAVYRASARRRVAYLQELFALDDDAGVLLALLGRTVQALRQEGIGLVTASFPSRSPEGRMLRGAGFQAWTTRLWNLELIVVGERQPDAGWLDAAAWHYSLGDWLTH